MMNISRSRVLPAIQHQSVLEKMGLREEVIRRAIHEGLGEYLGVTKLHPLTAGGSRAWQEVIASLREQLLSEDSSDWGIEHKRGLDLTYNREKNVNLVVTSGDKDTGREEGFPKTKNSKGAATRDFVGVNLSFFDEDNDLPLLEKKIDKTETWVLLYHIDMGKKEVRFELSLPKGMNGSANNIKINSWVQRIVFDSLPFKQDIKVKQQPDFNESVGFDITKKV